MSKDEAFAHAAPDGRVHSLEDHLREVGALARKFADSFGGGDSAEIAGLWHDLGKYGADFQRMIRGAQATEAHLEGDEAKKERVDHSTAGAFFAAQKAKEQKMQPHAMPIAFAIACHHCGLRDWRPYLTKRLLDRGQLRLDVAHAGAPSPEILAREVPPLPARVLPSSMKDLDGQRRLELFTRMIFSALCDADFLDTERFFNASKAELRGSQRTLEELRAALSASVDRLAKRDTEVNRARADIRAACIKNAAGERGVFTLTVPTGGGKTLAAMEFALTHARAHSLSRVIVAIPYTSILEQSARVYRHAFGLTDEDDAVLEHHSAIDPARETAKNRIASENWDAPVVVTTNVQLLESLFARKTSACRKLHNVARSVIILDEAQTLPRDLLAATTDVLENLVTDYGCSIVLSTATQPALTRAILKNCGFSRTTEIIDAPSVLSERLRRVDADFSRSQREVSWPELAVEVAREDDVLAIVHRRADARDLCVAIDSLTVEGSTVHLSALMCPAHRTRVLDDVRARKQRGEPVRLVATQLVEAGVDLDFPIVYRALAGIDSLTQAAGRCNREGKIHRGELRVFLAPTKPPKGILEQGFEHARAMLARELDLFSPAVHAEYFERLYNSGGDDVHDTREIQRHRAELAFEKTADAYRIVDDDWSAPLVVPYDERARRDLAAIKHAGPSRERLRALSRVTVNVKKTDLAAWLRSGAVVALADETVHALVSHSAYDDRFGLVPDRVRTLTPAQSVI